ncbi:MAG: tRNA (adenosine(37)-N6)-threonylcarbamoyltransferase complex ATPase subunit type 1 TsaE [Candidatus Pacebacteria bacterium]|nr:tRNA (adenosine(37)-N6)-threonylcarbamoyltransferase complex ATPase subunit type 1 TsaE [Candidatus Paceibacterota bacterium]
MLKSGLMKEYVLQSLKETREFAQRFAKNLTPFKANAKVYALSGDLGSGKTEFVRSIARALGVSSSVTSPTFVIQKVYPLRRKKFNNLIHIDAYRLKEGRELECLNWKETENNPGNLIFIEWSGNVVDALPARAIKLNFEFVNEHSRKIEM